MTKLIHQTEMFKLYQDFRKSNGKKYYVLELVTCPYGYYSAIRRTIDPAGNKAQRFGHKWNFSINNLQ